MSQYHVAIVGGGISGLVAALEIQRRARAHDCSIRTVVLEATNRFGGKIDTEVVDGFLVERGPDTFLASKPAGVQLCEELGLADQIIPTRKETQQSFLSHHGALIPLPHGMSGLVPNGIRGLLNNRLLSKPARVRACLERFVPSKQSGADESVFDFASRRYGREVAERIVEPLLAGIYAGDGRGLSAKAAVPQLCAMEANFGSVSRGMGKRVAPKTSPFISLEHGMQSLVDRLVERLDDVELRTSTPVAGMARRDDTWVFDLQPGAIHADTVVLAAPAYSSSEIVRPVSLALSEELSSIRFVSTATVAMGFTPPPPNMPKHGYGYIVPRAEGTATTACTWTTLKLPHRTPQGSFLTRVFLGRDGADDVVSRPDSEIELLARTELERTLGVVQRPTTVRVHRHERAMPQYDVGHLERLQRIDSVLGRHPGLFITGCSYRGVGIPDCIAAGKRAGMHVVRSLMAGVIE